MSTWEHFNGPFNINTTPPGPIGFSVIIHNKPNAQKTWDFRVHNVLNIGPALNQYRCFHVVDSITKALLFSNTVKFLHAYITQTIVTEGNRIVHALNLLSCAIKDAPNTIHYDQLTAISKLRDLLNNWIHRTDMDLPSPSLLTTKVLAPPAP